MSDVDASSIDLRVATREDWMQRGACRGLSTEFFFPDKGATLVAQRETCSACPVKAECLDFALRNGERFGIWGGTSERERRMMRREAGMTRPIASELPHGTMTGYTHWKCRCDECKAASRAYWHQRRERSITEQVA